MKHKHSVYDTDAHFSINPFTRAIKNESTTKVAVIQHDHNSERFTFEIPRRVDGHDMSLCDRVEVHYINMDSTNPENISADIYEVDDLQVSPDDSGFVVCSWLLSQNATKYAGSLNFLVRFVCLDEGKVAYAWHTAVFTGISVSNGILNNAEEIIEPFPDVLAQWKADLFGVGDTQEQRLLTVSAEQQAAIAAKGAAVLDSIPDEYEALQAQADENTRIKAGAIVLDAEGESIVVNDASDCYLQGLKLFGKSTQDGTPTPDAPVNIASVENPVVVVCGKNLFKTDFEPGYTETVRGVTFTVNLDRSIRVTGTPTAAIAYNIFEGEVFPVGYYFVSGAPATANQKFRLQVNLTVNGAEKTGGVDMGDGSKLSVDASVSSLRGYIYVASDAGEVDGLFYPQLEFGSVATEYEPYTGHTITIPQALPGIPVTSGGNYTDADGQQWICDEVDLKRGVYVQRVKKLVLDGSEQLNKYTYNGTNGISIYEILGDTHSRQNGFCTHSVVALVSNHDAPCMWIGVGNTALYWVGILDALGISTLDDATTYIRNQYESGNPITILYPIIDYVETALTDAEITAFKALHSNKPVTTILNDAGAFMAVEYVADTKTYIDNKIAELKGSE